MSHRPAQPDTPKVVLATLPTPNDAAQAAYGLKLRGITCELRRSRLNPLAPVELVISQADLERAQASWEYIIDALPHSLRAIDAKGRCAFCKYDCSGVPQGSPCPECGAALDSAAVRLAARDGKRPPRDQA